MPEFYEFFAGGGMVRAGMGAGWRCSLANDFDHKKSAIYLRNWGDDALKTADVRALTTSDLPRCADMAWASFPCQDLSLAGGGAGLKGDRSGTFWPFWNLMKDLMAEGRGPKIIALENVLGTLSSHGGKDFAAICNALQLADYRFGAVVIDAAHFLPHSRPRLFILAVRWDMAIPKKLIACEPTSQWHPRALTNSVQGVPTRSKENWVWWTLPTPSLRNASFSDLIEENPRDVRWHTPDETRALLGMMSEVNLAKVSRAKSLKRRIVGAIYKRTRFDENGFKVQRAEVRFDDIAGCLRTPAGGSSRQVILVVEGAKVRSRLISGRETARLMGLPEDYLLPTNYNEAYHLTGDGVVVPVVRFLAANLFEQVLAANLPRTKAAA
jgi:DNA (cytosine-5)-methyltransferase 1